MSEVLSYLAGVMDGDGSFGIAKLTTGRGAVNPLYYPHMQCSAVRPEFVQLLKDEFGGTVNLTIPRNKNHRIQNHWRVRSSVNCIPILEKLAPFLRIKKDRAEFLLEFCIRNPVTSSGQKTPLDVVEYRERCHLKMSQFNDWTGSFGKVSAKIARQTSEDPLFWAYMAGIMDTDGSFSVKKQVSNKGTSVKNPRYIAFIQLSMVDTRAINYIKENIPFGRICVPKNKSTSQGFHYQFAINKRDECIQFIEKVCPFLRSKKENALVVRDFCMNSSKTKICRLGVSDEELAFREECYQKLCALNKYGVYKPSLIDLEALQGDKAEGESHRERLSEMASQEGATV